MTAIIVGIAVGIAPALGASRTGITESLKTGTREGGGRTGRLRSLLLVVQPALAVVLLIGAGLFVRSLSRVRAIDLGFSPDRVLAVDVYWPAIRTVPAEDRERIQTVRDQFASEARDRLTNLPGIESAALTIGLPFHTSYGVRVRIPGRDSMPRFAGEGPGIAGVSEGYFETVGATLVRGRLFTADDLAGSEWVTVVNESMASTFWPGEDALGQCLTLYDDRITCVRVVGIVRDMKQWSLQELPNLQYFVPIAQAREVSGTLILVRPAGEPEESIARVREELVAMRADLPYVNVSTIQRRIDPQIRPWRMGAILFSVFGVLALIVAASGLYSVLAWLVEQRRHEFGVRSALGASTGRILASTIKRGVLPAVIGLAAGALMAFVAGTWLEPHLFETSARDPLVFGGAAGVLLLVAVLGALIPARRAAGVDPMVALREG
jgi:predicted permease